MKFSGINILKDADLNVLYRHNKTGSLTFYFKTKIKAKQSFETCYAGKKISGNIW